MRIELLLVIATMIIVSAVACATNPLSISCQVRVPTEFQQDPPGWISPTGEPESVRYKESYEAFWWNCVMMKAVNLESRCPFTCSGTPAATYGCSDGAIDAERQIKQLLKVHDKMKVKDYLQTVASNQEGKEKIKSYFPDRPRAEDIK
jgi:hypothetical protein